MLRKVVYYAIFASGVIQISAPVSNPSASLPTSHLPLSAYSSSQNTNTALGETDIITDPKNQSKSSQEMPIDICARSAKLPEQSNNPYLYTKLAQTPSTILNFLLQYISLENLIGVCVMTAITTGIIIFAYNMLVFHAKPGIDKMAVPFKSFTLGDNNTYYYNDDYHVANMQQNRMHHNSTYNPTIHDSTDLINSTVRTLVHHGFHALSCLGLQFLRGKYSNNIVGNCSIPVVIVNDSLESNVDCYARPWDVLGIGIAPQANQAPNQAPTLNPTLNQAAPQNPSPNQATSTPNPTTINPVQYSYYTLDTLTNMLDDLSKSCLFDASTNAFFAGLSTLFNSKKHLPVNDLTAFQYYLHKVHLALFNPFHQSKARSIEDVTYQQLSIPGNMIDYLKSTYTCLNNGPTDTIISIQDNGISGLSCQYLALLSNMFYDLNKFFAPKSTTLQITSGTTTLQTSSATTSSTVLTPPPTTLGTTVTTTAATTQPTTATTTTTTTQAPNNWGPAPEPYVLKANYSWEALPDTNAPDSNRQTHCMIILNDTIYIVFGYTSFYSNSMFTYNMTSNGPWKGVTYTSSNKPTSRGGVSCFIKDNNIMAFGGVTDIKPNNDLWSFDPLSNQWTNIIANGTATSPQPRGFQTTIVTLNSELIIFGGITDDKWLNSKYYNDVHMLDYNNQWQELSPNGTSTAPIARAYSAAARYQNKLFIFGGMFYNSVLIYKIFNDMWFFNLDTKTWQQVAYTGYIPPLSIMITNQVGDTLLINTGLSKPYGSGTTITASFNLATLTWTNLTNYLYQTYGSAGIINGSGIWHVFGGRYVNTKHSMLRLQ